MRDFPFLSFLSFTISVIPFIYTLILEKKLPILLKILGFCEFFWETIKYFKN